jgi:outer membrane protein OmpA-like peptidoglycan-associated protein
MRTEFNIQPETFAYEAEPGEFVGWQSEAPRARRTGGANAPIRYCVKHPKRVDCPDPTRSPAPDEIIDRFRFDGWRLNSRLHKPRIGIVTQRIVQSLATNRPIRAVLVAGHTDPVGNDNYNFGLGWRRAGCHRGGEFEWNGRW